MCVGDSELLLGHEIVQTGLSHAHHANGAGSRQGGAAGRAALSAHPEPRPLPPPGIPPFEADVPFWPSWPPYTPPWEEGFEVEQVFGEAPEDVLRFD
jgi:hypothetical protein